LRATELIAAVAKSDAKNKFKIGIHSDNGRLLLVKKQVQHGDQRAANLPRLALNANRRANITHMDDSRASERFSRVIGKRARPAAGGPPSSEARACMKRMAQYRTCVPKGVFIYESHEAANADWERWRIERMRQRQLPKADDD
jgi:hypothetical protein